MSLTNAQIVNDPNNVPWCDENAICFVDDQNSMAPIIFSTTLRVHGAHLPQGKYRRWLLFPPRYVK